MHTFLRSIGYAGIKSPAEEEKLVYKTIAESAIKKIIFKENGTKQIEYIRFVSEVCGIIVSGEEDEDGRFHFNYYIPFGSGDAEENFEDEIFISKRVDTDSYTGMCDDPRLGISIIFYILNKMDYLKFTEAKKRLADRSVKFSGLAESGNIILPTIVRVENNEGLNKYNEKKISMIAEAKKGNQEAIEQLMLADIDRREMISGRINNEDILSIVDTSIVPYGSESDMYKITGNIRTCKRVFNTDTGEEIWHMIVDCNDIPIDVYINKEDLTGEPEVGRRFRGSVWLQGQLVLRD